jgi:hypothetical protein
MRAGDIDRVAMRWGHLPLAGQSGAFVRDPDGNNVEAICHA